MDKKAKAVPGHDATNLPRSPPPGLRQGIGMFTMRRARQVGAVVSVATMLWRVFSWAHDSGTGLSHHLSPLVNWDQRRDAVKEAFVASWDAYSQNAWGNDEYHPTTQTGSQMSPNGLGWIIIDSLDTMMVMNLTSQLAECRKWLQRSLTWDQDQEVNTFETTIRMLGGLLSAHYLSKRMPEVSSSRDNIYLEKATDLADRLLSAYTSASGIPYTSVNIGKRVGIPSQADGGASSLAEAGTVQLEMKYLSHLTGNMTYWRTAETVMKVLDDNAAQDGLLPIFIHPETGRFTTREIRLGSRGDSYYEYLVKQHLQTAEPVYLDMWDEALAGMQAHLVVASETSGLRYVAELPHGVGGEASPKMDHLACFLPGAVALGATGGRALGAARGGGGGGGGWGWGWGPGRERQVGLARDLARTCWGMHAVTRTGLAPEIAWFRTLPSGEAARTSDRLSAWRRDYIIRPADAHNLQRPETVESLFVMWRITGDPIYREWGWKIFKAFERHTFVGAGKGYTSVNDVNSVPPPSRDNMESFWLAETLKYLYLLFSPNDLLPLDEVVFNTEAHILPRFQEQRWSTGWKRNRPVR